jgi:hypothetical protein
MSQPVPDADLAAISDSLFAGRKIEAIKKYRECTGVGLAEAKVAVERIESDLRNETPTKFTAPRSKGCGTTAAVLLGFVIVGVWGVGKLLS